MKGDVRVDPVHENYCVEKVEKCLILMSYSIYIDVNFV